MKPLKKLFFLFWLCFSQLARAQSNPNDVNTNVVRLPASPEVYSLFKASEIPVGHFSGTANFSIPIYTINLKDFNWPISLGYATSGIKTEELSGNVGLGWNLNATGVLSQLVNGKNDLVYNNGGYILDSSNASNFSGDGPTYSSDYNHYLMAKRFANGELEWATDLFTYSIGGFSGKFFFDQFDQAHTMPLSQVKIKNMRSELDIWDEKGVFYQFKNSDAEEYEYGSCFSVNPQASYFLSKITTPNGNSITFEYDTLTYSYVSLNSEIIATKVFGFECTSADNPVAGNTCSTLTNTIHAKLLKKITSSNGEVITFTYSSSTRKDLPGAKFLESIVVKYKDIEFVKKLNLQHNYFGDSTGAATACRLKLTGVTEEASDGEQHNLYKMVYDESSTLPDRLSKSQDHWGFYNGKYNTTLLPSNLEQNYVGADRSPDFTYTKLASLKKITYPTGGFSSFEYEPNDYYTSNEKVDSLTYYTSSQYNSVYSDIVSYTITIPSNAKNITLVRDITGCPNPPDYSGEADNCTITFTNGSGVTYNYDCHSVVPSEQMVDIPSGNYTVTLNNNNGNIFSYFKVKYFRDYGYYFTGNRQSGGLRIKTVTSQTDSLSKPQITSYVYRKFDNPSRSSGSAIWLPQYEYGQSKYYWQNASGEYYGCRNSAEASWGDASSRETQYHILRSNSVLPLTNIDGGSVGYENVAEIKKDTTYGKTEFTYQFVGDPGGDYGFPFSARGTNAWKRGQLLKKITYKFNSSDRSFLPLTKEENFYSERPYSDFWNRLYSSASNVGDAYKGLGLQIIYKLPEVTDAFTVIGARFFIGRYNYESKWLRMDSTIATQYDGSNELKSVTRLSYNGTKHIQLTEQSVTNSKGLVEKTKILYPQDSIGVAVMDSLIAKNRVGIATETKHYVNDSLIKSTKTQYQYWGNGLTDVELIKTSTYNNPLQTEVTVNSYDNKGNIIQYQKRNGLINSFILDYDTTLIVSSVVNASASSIAYTSFEANGANGWSFTNSNIGSSGGAITGNNYYTIPANGSIGCGIDLNSSKTYILSYWAKDGFLSLTKATGAVPNVHYVSTGTLINSYTNSTTGWTYYEYEITNTTNFAIDNGAFGVVQGVTYVPVKIDELRLYPRESLMTTYTYAPLIGITSQCDPAGHITYYNYDNLGRLQTIKDQNQNILKKYDYKYASQQ